MLTDEYQLVDLREVPDCFVKQVILGNRDSHFPTIAACVKKEKYPKAISEENSDELGSINQRLLTSLLKVDLIASLFALKEYCKPKRIFHGNLIPNDSPFGLNMNVEGIMDPSVADLFLSVRDCSIIGGKDPFIDTIRNILEYNSLDEKQLEKCMRAMNRIAKSKDTKELYDKILDLSIALELLLLDDKDHGELS